MKKVHRFLLPEQSVLPINTVTDERIVHQIVRVLRLRVGEQIIVFWDKGPEIVLAITEIQKDVLSVQQIKVGQPAPAPTRKVFAAVSIAKGDTFSLIVQKLTELGVATIIPVISSHTVKQSVRLDRLEHISNEALEQCGGTAVVTIHPPMTLSECRSVFPLPAVVFDIPDTPAVSDFSEVKRYQELIMYIGPEGGWNDEDRKVLSGAAILHLGQRVLRTETAAIVGAYELLK